MFDGYAEPYRKKGKGKGKGKGKEKGKSNSGDCRAVIDGQSICFDFNSDRQKCTKGKKCRYTHVCGRCGKERKPMYECKCTRQGNGGS